MAAKGDRDAVTGVETTGHEWDGIRELNNPLPKWWVYTFYVSIAIAVVMWVLFPSWPTGRSYFPGLLRSNERLDFERRYAAAKSAQSQWTDRIAALDAAAIQVDPELVQFAIAGGEKSFKNNCATCHGLGGAGQGFFPSLADDSWIWGGTIDQIELTIRHGIRNGEDPDARDNAMPAFGVDGLLDKGQIADVTQHVLSLTHRATDAEAAGRGAAVFAENCASCHGEEGQGVQELGGPALNDMIWLYGGEPSQITAQIHRPRLGVMPNWQGRLDDTTIKMLAVYVHSLGGGQ
ncbi:MAG: cytochrome-c oxidase, cbb3-type subunit III [Geminicoccaceae bacterium]